ncbi:MAG: maltose alpha-D-glucosyltransferase [Nitrospirae bacterium]|nr:maltose alpha-D-glucosyltransferase [Nitrospirota bacterium]
MRKKREVVLEDDPLWYKDAIIYELHVRSFHDSNGDGIGDFKGLTEKLDYLEDLGITAVWLLPFYPSPLKDDGYDIADYLEVNPDYGTLKEFRQFLREAHSRGIRVITEIVLNHTSAEHIWFQKARRAKPGSFWRDFYVWTDTTERYKDARIIFKDFETSNWTWDPAAGAYYWHRFYSHQPDLNYDNPHVRKAMLRVVDYWLGMGVDGIRLDAAPYLFERDGTNCENLPETHDFLKFLRKHVEETFKNKMLLAEANQWPEDAVAYFGDGDECQMAFHFPLMPRMFMSIWMEDKFPIIDIFEQTPSISEICQWALFLRNHDELTLEMVTDEERDYMYRVYGKDPRARINLGIRRRLAPLLGNHRRKIELMNFLLLSLPGTPVLYYGDEIGMGDNFYLGDRNGVRTPMQWSADKNAGFSRANPQKLFLPIIIDPEYHYEAVNVETQQGNQAALLWWMKRVITMRKHSKALGRGEIEFLYTDNPKVIAFIRHFNDENMLVVVNLSRFSQVVEIDLSTYCGYLPEEVFSRNRFPAIKETPYVLTLGFYDYYWFTLKKEDDLISQCNIETIPHLNCHGAWGTVLQGKTKEQLEKEILPVYMLRQRWFGAKARQIQQSRISEIIPVGKNATITYMLFIEVQYSDGLPETYLLPVSFVSGEEADRLKIEIPYAILAILMTDDTEGIIYDGIYNEEFRKNLLLMHSSRQGIKGLKGELTPLAGKYLKTLTLSAEEPLSEKSQVFKAEQSNSSLLYGNHLILKLYRRLEEGINPEMEVGRYLTETAAFTNIPPFAGALEYRRKGNSNTAISILQGYVPNQGDAWRNSIDAVERYIDRVLSRRDVIEQVPAVPSSFVKIAYQDEMSPALTELIFGFYHEMAGLLGKRTAELHLALSSCQEPDFSPEPFSVLYQKSIYQSVQSLTKRVFQTLRRNLKNLPEAIRPEAEDFLSLEVKIVDQFKAILRKKISAMKIRVHGDYHLGQVLFSGKDFIIIDFEGEPARPVNERRLKRSPVRDLAGMIRSFHYAGHSALSKSSSVRDEDLPLLRPWIDLWYAYVGGTFLRSYLDTAGNASFIPDDLEELDILLKVFMLEKAVYELGYELNNRPDWVHIPMKGIKQLLD